MQHLQLQPFGKALFRCTDKGFMTTAEALPRACQPRIRRSTHEEWFTTSQSKAL